MTAEPLVEFDHHGRANPANQIGELHRMQSSRSADDTANAHRPGTPESAEMQQRIAWIAQPLAALLEERRRNPKDDMSVGQVNGLMHVPATFTPGTKLFPHQRLPGMDGD